MKAQKELKSNLMLALETSVLEIFRAHSLRTGISVNQLIRNACRKGAESIAASLNIEPPKGAL